MTDSEALARLTAWQKDGVLPGQHRNYELCRIAHDSWFRLTLDWSAVAPGPVGVDVRAETFPAVVTLAMAAFNKLMEPADAPEPPPPGGPA